MCKLLSDAHRGRHGLDKSSVPCLLASELVLGEVKLHCGVRADCIGKRSSEQAGGINPARSFANLKGRCIVTSHEIGEQADG